MTPALPIGLSRPVRIMVVGDSTAMATGNGMLAWAAAHPDVASVAVLAAPGCGFIRDGWSPPTATTGSAATAWRSGRADPRQRCRHCGPTPSSGWSRSRDIEDRVWDDAEGPIGPADDRFLARLVDDYDAATQTFLAAGATDVLWVLAPIPALPLNAATAALPRAGLRHARYAAAMHEVAARHPGQASVVDLAAWFATQQVPPDAPGRPALVARGGGR